MPIEGMGDRLPVEDLSSDEDYKKIPSLDLPLNHDENYKEGNKSSSAKKGCLFGMGCAGCGMLGCLGVIILSVILLIAGVSWVKDNFISGSPLDIPSVYLTADEEEKLMEKVDHIRNTSHEEADDEITLELTADEINYFVQKRGDKAFNIYVEVLENDSVNAKISSHINDDQYVNITGNAFLDIRDSQFMIKINSLTVGNYTFQNPKELQAVSQALNSNIPETHGYLSLSYIIKNLRVENGVFYMHLKRNKTSTATDAVDDDCDPSG